LISAVGLFAANATMVFFYTLEGQQQCPGLALPAVTWVMTVFAGTLA